MTLLYLVLGAALVLGAGWALLELSVRTAEWLEGEEE